MELYGKLLNLSGGYGETTNARHNSLFLPENMQWPPRKEHGIEIRLDRFLPRIRIAAIMPYTASPAAFSSVYRIHVDFNRQTYSEGLMGLLRAPLFVNMVGRPRPWRDARLWVVM